MERNWYIVWTKINQEKKTVAELLKRGIECYCPLINPDNKNHFKNRNSSKPLFNSFVFAKISMLDLPTLDKISWILSLAYWQSEHLILDAAYVDAMKVAVNSYTNLKLEKCAINVTGKVTFTEESSNYYHENYLSIQQHGIRIQLPALGYILVGERSVVGMGSVKKDLIISS